MAWLLGQRLLPRLHAAAPSEAAALFRRAGVRDAALGASAGADAYGVRLAALAGRLGERDRRTAAAVERVQTAVAALQTTLGRAPARAPLAVHLEAWRAGLEAAGFWTALETEAFDDGPPARLAAAREAEAVETWRTFVRDVRAGWKAAGHRGPDVDRRGFARWLAEATSELPVSGPGGAPGGAPGVYSARYASSDVAWLPVHRGAGAETPPRTAGPPR